MGGLTPDKTTKGGRAVGIIGTLIAIIIIILLLQAIF